MINKNLIILLISIVIIGGGVFYLTSNKKSSLNEEQQSSTNQPIESPETLNEILNKGRSVSSIKFDMIMESPQMNPITMTVWHKNNKMRTEMVVENQKIVNLLDLEAKTAYMYMPDMNMATKGDFSQTPKSPLDNFEGIEKYNPRITGTEIIDGKNCIIIEYNADDVKTKLWVWEEKGFPLKIETITNQGKTTIYYKNIDFSDIPDSIFELPKGVQIITNIPINKFNNQ